MHVKAFTTKRPRVEMVPLIDMFFLLLIFFIFGVFSMTMQQGILVDLPTAQTGTSSEEEHLTISIDAGGALWLNRQPVTLNTLGIALRQSAPEQTVIINADRQVAHGTVIAVLDAVRQAGLSRVSFQTDPAQP
ncbi:MAG: biopolymer transporter ExbD [Candidatus Omnitrophica bacterium]|nr:biopolymer transporter ExbD [Candidatus Omnitrophota bacterium]